MEGVHETLLPTDDEEITVCSGSENGDSSDCGDETVNTSDPMPTFSQEHTDRNSGTSHYRDTESTYGDDACVYDQNNTYGSSTQAHTVVGHKSSKEQRAKINLRERKRMHDLNSAMESLREVMPYGCGPTVRKLSKIATLSVARNYIIMLNRTVAELKQKLEHVYRAQYVGPTAHRRQSTGLHSYGSRFGFSQTNTNANLGYGIPDIHNPCQLGSEPLPIHCANRLSVPGDGVVKCQCCMTSSSSPELGWFRVNGNSLSSNTMTSYTSSNLRR